MKEFVIMADVIDSSSYAGDLLMTDFKSRVDKINATHRQNIKSPLTITLGDEFQGIVKDLKAACAIIFSLDEALLQSDLDYKLRYAVHYGEVDTPINKKNAHEMLGKGLSFARKQLEELKVTGGEVMISGTNQLHCTKINLAGVIYRSFYNDWHKKDRHLVYDFLQNDDYKELAKIHKKDPSSMWRKKRSLKIDDFKASRELITLLAND